MSVLPSTWPPELAFVACCARTEVDDEVTEQIRSLADRVEWDDVVCLARFHRVLPLVSESTQAACADRVPDEILTFLRQQYLATAAFNLRIALELRRIREALEDRNVRSIYFKGSILAQYAYRNMGLRPCTDIDLLIAESDFDRAEKTLRAVGYRPVKPVESDGTVDMRALRIAGQCPFVHAEHSWSIDVHTTLMPAGYSYSIGFDELYERHVPVLQDGEPVPGFCAEDLVLILCLHGAKNRWEALKYVCDVAELIRSHPDMDWERVLTSARSVSGERILCVGLELARRVLDAPLPPVVVAQLEKDARVHELVRKLLSQLRESHNRVMGRKERIKFHLNIQDSILGRARYGLYVLTRRLKGLTK